MNRRAIIAGLAALPMAAGQSQAAMQQPFRVSLIGGALDGQIRRAGVRIDLDPGWKTYWRMPGEAGIPPQFDWTKSKGVGDVEVLYPLPQRLHDLSGETVGYEGLAIFPVIVTQAVDTADAKLHLDLFFAVCKDICIPAKAQAMLAPARSNSSSVETGLVQEWIRRVPAPGLAVRSLEAMDDGGKPLLLAKLLQPADDIFVESSSPVYFRKPAFSADGLEARLPLDNVKAASEVRGLRLKLTIATGSTGIEQSITVA